MTKKPAVYLQHCLDCDMMVWVVNDPKIGAPAFMLSDAGYDVWLGNNRGTKYGMRHTTLNNNDPKFWDFDQETMGLQDVPANIEFILNKTGNEKLSYIGHSEGTTQLFMASAMKPDYFFEKLNIFIALAPIVNMKN